MKKSKRVLIICGTGIATSTVVADQVERLAEELGVNVNVIQCKATEARAYVDEDIDLVVATTPVNVDLKAPLVNGVPFLSGVGVDQTVEKIKEILNS